MNENANAELTLYLASPAREGTPFCAEIHREASDETIQRCLPANCPVMIPLPAGRYRVTVKNQEGFDPGGITRWVTLVCGRRRSVHMVFRALCGRPPIRLTVAVTDSNYPNITPINGGITVCQQQKTTP